MSYPCDRAPVKELAIQTLLEWLLEEDAVPALPLTKGRVFLHTLAHCSVVT